MGEISLTAGKVWVEMCNITITLWKLGEISLDDCSGHMTSVTINRMIDRWIQSQNFDNDHP